MSQQRAGRAIEEGRFKSQIVPVPVPQRRGDPLIVDTDEHPRPDTTLEALSKLPAAFKDGGTVTAGNASRHQRWRRRGWSSCLTRRPGSWASSPACGGSGRAVAGVDPALMGTGPVPAVRKVLKKTGMSIDDIDLIELNEAFAAQAYYCIRELGLDIEKTNVNGQRGCPRPPGWGHRAPS